MTTGWNRTGAVPAGAPLAWASWNGDLIVSNGAAVLVLEKEAWRRMGDHLPGVVSLAVTPQGELLAGGHFGIHRWNPVESQWRPVVALANVVSLAVDGCLFAATELDGVFVSVDEGLTWRPWSMGLSDQRVDWMRATDRGVELSTPSGQFVLTGAAERWHPTPASPDVDEMSFADVPALPASPLGELRDTPDGLLWTARDGVEHHSTDGGTTWTSHRAESSAPAPQTGHLPADLRELIEGAYGAVAVVERARERDRWTAILRAPGREGPWAPVLSTTGIAPVVVTEHDGGLMVAIGHRFMSDPLVHGSRPQAAGQLPDPQSIVLALASHGSIVFAATANGIWQSSDGGFTWECSMSSAIPIVAVCAGSRGVAVDADGSIFTMPQREAA